MNKNQIILNPNNAVLTSYLHEDGEVRQCILVLPGGAYRYCAPGEGEPVALAFYENGFDACVLEYSCTDGSFHSPLAGKDEVLTRALEDYQSAFAYLKENGYEQDQISVTGFSAGANLALSGVVLKGLHPFSLILGYGTYSGSLMKELGLESIDLLEKIDETMVPVFMFLCQGDSTVPAKESLDLASALSEHGVPFELHVYATGDHGLSLGRKESGVVNRDYATWFDHALAFERNIRRKTPLVLGDLDEDLSDLSINSRIGALMYHEEAWKLIEELFPQIAFQAKTDSKIRSVVLQRIWQWGLVKEPSPEEVNELLKKIR